jgi:hypothetical protein
VERWLDDFRIPHDPPVPWQGGTKWVLEACPFDESHTGTSAAVFREASGRLGFKCLHKSCEGRTWRDFRTHFEPDRSHRYQATEGRKREEPKKQTREEPVVMSAAGISTAQFPATEMLIEGVVPLSGASLVVGAAKSCKTILSVQIAIAVARGLPLFDNYRVLKPGAALVLEQDDPAGMGSIKEILLASAVPEGTPFFACARVPWNFGTELLEFMEKQITSLGLRLFVLDSYTALRGPRPSGCDIVKQEQAELNALDDVAKRLGCAVLIVHHGSKGASGQDWASQGAGTYAMGAATEAQIHISRFPDFPSNAPERLIRTRGRHMEGGEMVLRFRKPTIDMQLVLDGPAASFYPLLEQIRGEFPGQQFTPKELCRATGMAHATAHRHIARLLQAGGIRRVDYGVYVLAKY